MFQLNEIVVYNNHGLYQIQDIGSLDFIPSKEIYYTLQSLKDTGDKFYIPLKQEGKLRYIITKEMAAYCLLKLPGLSSHYSDKVSVRELEYKNIFNSNDYMEWMALYKTITSIRQRCISTKKRFCIKDDRALKRIEEMISSEFSLALNIPKEDFRRNLLLMT